MFWFKRLFFIAAVLFAACLNMQAQTEPAKYITDHIEEGKYLSHIALRHALNAAEWNKLIDPATGQPFTHTTDLKAGQEVLIPVELIKPAPKQPETIEAFCSTPTISAFSECVRAFSPGTSPANAAPPTENTASGSFQAPAAIYLDQADQDNASQHLGQKKPFVITESATPETASEQNTPWYLWVIIGLGLVATFTILAKSPDTLNTIFEHGLADCKQVVRLEALFSDPRIAKACQELELFYYALIGDLYDANKQKVSFIKSAKGARTLLFELTAWSEPQMRKFASFHAYCREWLSSSGFDYEISIFDDNMVNLVPKQRPRKMEPINLKRHLTFTITLRKPGQQYIAGKFGKRA